MANLSKNRTRFDPETRTIMADASDLGFPPGVWPEVITLFDYPEEGQVFLRSNADRLSNGDLSAVHYYSYPSSKDHLMIFND